MKRSQSAWQLTRTSPRSWPSYACTTAFVTVSDTASATASVTSSEAPAVDTNSAARRRSRVTADGSAGSTHAAFGLAETPTIRTLPSGLAEPPARASLLRLACASTNQRRQWLPLACHCDRAGCRPPGDRGVAKRSGAARPDLENKGRRPVKTQGSALRAARAYLG